MDSIQEVDSASLFGHTSYQAQFNESYWWESHVPTRLYLAPRDMAGASQGTSGRS